MPELRVDWNSTRVVDLAVSNALDTFQDDEQ